MHNEETKKDSIPNPISVLISKHEPQKALSTLKENALSKESSTVTKFIDELKGFVKIYKTCQDAIPLYKSNARDLLPIVNIMINNAIEGYTFFKDKIEDLPIYSQMQSRLIENLILTAMIYVEIYTKSLPEDTALLTSTASFLNTIILLINEKKMMLQHISRPVLYLTDAHALQKLLLNNPDGELSLLFTTAVDTIRDYVLELQPNGIKIRTSREEIEISPRAPSSPQESEEKVTGHTPLVIAELQAKIPELQKAFEANAKKLDELLDNFIKQSSEKLKNKKNIEKLTAAKKDLSSKTEELKGKIGILNKKSNELQPQMEILKNKVSDSEIKFESAKQQLNAPMSEAYIKQSEEKQKEIATKKAQLAQLKDEATAEEDAFRTEMQKRDDIIQSLQNLLTTQQQADSKAIAHEQKLSLQATTTYPHNRRSLAKKFEAITKSHVTEIAKQLKIPNEIRDKLLSGIDFEKQVPLSSSPSLTSS